LAIKRAVIDIFSSFSISGITVSDIREIENPVSSAEFYGAIKISGDISGMIEIALNKSMAITLAACVGHCDPNQLSENDYCDGVGETINQITGRARTLLWDLGYKTEILVPQITVKSSLIEFIQKNKQTIYIIDFNCSEYFIALQTSLQINKTKNGTGCLSLNITANKKDRANYSPGHN